jgi:5-methylcytosine-specific restriction endonuclease McrA
VAPPCHTVPLQRYSVPRFSDATRSDSAPCRCPAMWSLATASLFSALPLRLSALHFRAWPLLLVVRQLRTSPPHSVTTPRLCFALAMCVGASRCLCLERNLTAVPLDNTLNMEYSLSMKRQYTKRQPPVEKTCIICGSSFSVLAHELRIKPHRCCSEECYRTYQKKASPQPCKGCGKEIIVAPWQQRRRKYGVFCSHKCYGLWRTEHLQGPNSPLWKGGLVIYYQGSWKKQRQATKRRDRFTCQDCGVSHPPKSGALIAHHIVPYNSFDDSILANKLENLTTLCRPCHAFRHSTSVIV